MKKGKIEIYQPWGGLGDNLAHSIIPELCRERGINCFLSKHNASRNQQIHEFVWGLNPFLEKERTDFKDMAWLQKCTQYEAPGQINHIQVIQKVYGFNTNFEYPKIYYTPKKINSFNDKTIIDLSAYSIYYDYKQENLKDIIRNFNLNKNKTISITPKNVDYGGRFDIGDNTIDITSLEQYSDILFSCQRFITLHSGQACLASTIKHQTKTNLEINVITTEKYLPENSAGYTFKNTNYIKCN